MRGVFVSQIIFPLQRTLPLTIDDTLMLHIFRHELAGDDVCHDGEVGGDRVLRDGVDLLDRGVPDLHPRHRRQHVLELRPLRLRARLLRRAPGEWPRLGGMK